jgi:hypothetical protein
MVRAMAAAANRQARFLVGIEKSREGPQSKCQGKQDGKHAPHASLMLHECDRGAENEEDTCVRYHRCIAALTP